MIRDARHPVWTKAWSAYVRWKFQRAFRGLWMRGALPADEPVVLYANHTNFWDGFVAHLVVQGAAREGYVMMEERNLERFRFLRRLGAFSVRRGSPASARESLRHAAGLLERPRSTVLVFPQGKLEPYRAALHCERGAELLARWARVRCVPMVIRYEVFEHEFPDVLVAVGAPHEPCGPIELAARLSDLRSVVDSIEAPEGLPRLVVGRRSVAE
ncbi:MAG: lysophospholipid acyltransferase family protein [Archangium sp.]|nr:lysophospholipid acyltransferase family protein [Archangium sp.]